MLLHRIDDIQSIGLYPDVKSHIGKRCVVEKRLGNMVLVSIDSSDYRLLLPSVCVNLVL